MKILVAVILLVITNFCFAEEAGETHEALEVEFNLLGDFRDPRQLVILHEWIDKGSVKNRPVSGPINHSILIICWMPDPTGGFDTYQISGIEGYHSREKVETFLRKFYELEQPKNAGWSPVNLVLAGNNWGAGQSLHEVLKTLSEKFEFKVFYSGGWAFEKAILVREPQYRLSMVQKAFTQASSREQDAGKPATAPESKAEGKEKPKPASEDRPQ